MEVNTPSIRRERHEERRPRPFIASSWSFCFHLMNFSRPVVHCIDLFPSERGAPVAEWTQWDHFFVRHLQIWRARASSAER